MYEYAYFLFCFVIFAIFFTNSSNLYVFVIDKFASHLPITFRFEFFLAVELTASVSYSLNRAFVFCNSV